MTFAKFFGLLLAMLVGALLLVWVFVSIAALVYALTLGDGAAAQTYAIFSLAGVAVCVFVAWVARRVARTRVERQ